MAEADSKYARQKEKGGVTEAHAQAFKKYQMAFKTLSDDDSTSSAKKEAKRILRWYDKNYPNGQLGYNAFINLKDCMWILTIMTFIV